MAVADWERAERARSDAEALTVTGEELLASEQDAARYLSPPADTAYPLEYLYHLVGSICGLSVLDLGCGSGMHTLYLMRRGASVRAVDLSWSLLRCTRQRLSVCSAGRPSLAQGSAHALPFASGSFDLVFANAILHHLDTGIVAKELRRVLKPTGRAVFQEPMRESRLLRIVRRCIPYQGDPVSPFERPLTRRDLQPFSSGFELRRFRAFSLPHVRLAHALNVPHRALERSYKWDGWLLRNAPFLERYGSIAVFELVRRG